MIEELTEWLERQKIVYEVVDHEVVNIPDFGKMYMADLSDLTSIFRGDKGHLEFNLVENADVLSDEGIQYVAFSFGRNWYYYGMNEGFKFNILRGIGRRRSCQHKTDFINLGVHSCYELLNSVGNPERWCRKASWLGHHGIGICDKHTLAGTLILQEECEQLGIKSILGYSFDMELDGEKVEMKVYSLTQIGLGNLLRMQKEIMVDSQAHVLPYERLLYHAKGNVLVFGKRCGLWMLNHRRHVERLKQVFERVYFQVDASEYKADRIDREVLESLGCYFENFGNALTLSFEVAPILIADCYYPDADDAGLRLVLNKIGTGASHEQSDDQYFKDVDEHYERLSPLFSERWNFDQLFEMMCEATLEIAELSEVRYETSQMYMPEYMMTIKETEAYGDRRTMFRKLLDKGLEEKVIDSDRGRYRERLDDEVYIIESTNQVDYFLIQWDMVQEAYRRGIVTGIGRGSAGGSLVAYLLGIISIDPLCYDLLFSRFLVPERCGLNWVDELTVIAPDLRVSKGEMYVDAEMDNSSYRICKDARMRIKRKDEVLTVYADELICDDEILFDRRDLLWTLKEFKRNGSRIFRDAECDSNN